MAMNLGTREVFAVQHYNAIKTFFGSALDFRKQAVHPEHRLEFEDAVAEAEMISSQQNTSREAFLELKFLNMRVQRCQLARFGAQGADSDDMDEDEGEDDVTGVVTSYDNVTKMFTVDYTDGDFTTCDKLALQELFREANASVDIVDKISPKKRSLSNRRGLLSSASVRKKPQHLKRAVEGSEDGDSSGDVSVKSDDSDIQEIQSDEDEDDDFSDDECDLEDELVSTVVKKKRKKSTTTSTTDSTVDTRGMIGKNITKKFDGVEFEGEVVSFDAPYYLVRYRDGDEEELSFKEIRRLLPRKVRVSIKDKGIRHAATPPPWQIAGGGVGIFVGGFRPVVIELENSINRAGMNFYSEYFSKDRTLIIRQLVNKSTSEKPMDTEFVFNNIFFSLMGVNSKEEIGFRGMRRHYAEYMFVGVRGPGLSSVCLRTALERVANFAAIRNPRKILKRLELFASKAIAKCPPCRRHISEFEIIDEAISDVTHESMGDGCGYISDELLSELLSTKSQNTHLAVQVRVFGPQLGVWKGMLCRKPGIRGVQLTESMRKVGRSVVCDDEWVSLVIIRVSPSTSSSELSRLYKGFPPNKHFQKKDLSPMIRNVWMALGVPKGVVYKYERNKIPSHNGGFVGLADPTSSLPSKHVFVTGVHDNVEPFPDKVFITRSPCVRPEDGRILPVIHSKPDDMSTEHWEWMLNLPFGGVIFSTQGNGVPLPAICADGDLDGDLYFLCWADDILNYITPRPEPKASAAASSVGLAVAVSSNVSSSQQSASSGSSINGTVVSGINKLGIIKHRRESVPSVHGSPPGHISNSNGYSSISESPTTRNWFEEVQRHVVTSNLADEHALVAKMYNLMQKVHETSNLGMDDPDAIAYANAYLSAIDRGKHDIEVLLPPHLLKALGVKPKK
jgi:hypothetical protein